MARPAAGGQGGVLEKPLTLRGRARRCGLGALHAALPGRPRDARADIARRCGQSRDHGAGGCPSLARFPAS